MNSRLPIVILSSCASVLFGGWPTRVAAQSTAPSGATIGSNQASNSNIVVTAHRIAAPIRRDGRFDEEIGAGPSKW